MRQTIDKARIVRAVESLPDDATLDDATERLIFLRKIELGLRQAEAGEGMSQADVEAYFARRREQRSSFD